MKKQSVTKTVIIALLLSMPTFASATIVSVFDNGSFVDTFGGTGAESDEIQASLISLGHTVNTFTGFDATAWNNAFSSGEAVLIPELRSNLLGSMDAASRTALAANVSAGGGLIITEGFSSSLSLMNTVFGFSLSAGSGSGTWTLNGANASGTAFSGGPATIPDNNSTDNVTTASLPGGALALYELGADTSVFTVGFGAGSLTFLGWDWYNALPGPGTQDGGWNQVLDSAVATAANTNNVPEPSIVSLMALSFLAFVFSRRKLHH